LDITIAHQYIWKVAYRLVAEEEYTILQAEEEKIHLLRQRGRDYHYIQIQLVDFLWGATLDYDIRDGAARLEDIRRQLGARSIKGSIVYVCWEPVIPAMQDALEKEEGIDESSVSLYAVAYGLKERSWVGGSQKSFLFRPEVFTETEVEEDRAASYWMQQVERVETEREREVRTTLFYGKPRFTYLFLAVIIAVFILMEFSGGSENPMVLILFGAKFNPLIVAGEWWRLITPMFLHIGFMHILFNGIALHSLGTLTEQLYGSARFFMIYMVAGISGVMASFVFSPNISAGASGAIFGLFGALLYFGTQNKELFFRTLGSGIFVVLGINLSIGFLYPSTIDNYAHLGGLLGGFLAAAFVGLPQYTTGILQKAGAGVVLVALLWWGMQSGGF
jgi:rhomboid protease GluP